ncbi:MAG: 4Fe-4S dicluster domain-containing protein [Ruminococcaceae bacterium]|nr:4Fe-4S dicluster domain-containing protein [Oscillospiraceae bacterium]
MKILINLIRVFFLVAFVILIQNGKMMLWLGLYALSLVLALAFGRIYCGYVCPMNTVMQPAEWLAKKLKIQTASTPKWLQSGNFGWFALVFSVGLMLITRRLGRNIPVLLIWLAVSFVVTLRYKPAVFHNLLCPFGPLQRVFGKRAFFSERVDHNACIGCKKCEKPCPTGAIFVSPENKKATINTADCLQCTNCQQVCPTKAISYRKEATSPLTEKI